MMDSLLFIAIGVLSRLVPHPANFTAVGGLALFSGAQYGVRKASFITIATMLASDIFLGFHPVMWATYGSLFFGVVLGTVLRSRPQVSKIVSITLLSSILFFLITNFAVWVMPGSMYPKTTVGLINCYIAALPFFRNSLAGDLFYTSVFFGVAEITAFFKRKVFIGGDYAKFWTG